MTPTAFRGSSARTGRSHSVCADRARPVQEVVAGQREPRLAVAPGRALLEPEELPERAAEPQPGWTGNVLSNS